MPCNDVMLDIESLSTAPDACILSIGACRFNIETGDELHSEHYFHRTIDIDSNIVAGRRIDGRTVTWWMDQSTEAQSAVFRALETIALKQALDDFSDYLRRMPYDRIWCRGAAFDFPALASAYRAVGRMDTPWPYYAVRCQRTLEDLAGIEALPRDSTTHNALDDAIYQAHSAVAQWAALSHRQGTVVSLPKRA